ncbi:unnamed protein product [Symbiodinium necroappetens]|uniref:Uncharacterized protein n=1 Tax=Symbiodinium necroappetens TaxID=1628268 RepID=A0A812ZAX0_9DINO|nr:unnamed protein product [Symbiodinium necroappetens]
MGRGKKWGENWANNAQLWRGSWSTASPKAPWKPNGPGSYRSAQASEAFPAFDAQTVQLPLRGREIAPKELAAAGHDGGEILLLNNLQSMLNTARKAEGRTAKACAAREQLKAQWEKYLENMKDSWLKEKRRFEQAMAKQDKEVAEAREAQASARKLIRQAALPVTVERGPTPMEEDSMAWEELRASWDAEQDQELDGVLRRALEETQEPPPVTPLRSTQAMPRTPTPSHPAAAVPLTTPTARSDPYVSATGVAPIASPAPEGTAAALEAAEAAALEASRRTPRTAGPRLGIKTTSKTSPAPPSISTSLSEKIEARRKALNPFGRPGPALAATAELAATSLVEDDPDESEELLQAHPSPGLGKME